MKKKDEYVLNINIKKIREMKKISNSKIIEFMGWANNSILYKKERGIVTISIKEALMLSKLLKEPVEKIFTLKVSKDETK